MTKKARLLRAVALLALVEMCIRDRRHPGMFEKVLAATQSGVQVLYINYELDRGSLLFLRSTVRNVWSNNCKNGFTEMDSNLDFHRLELPEKCELEL